jgi:serine/threonine protein kinase
MRVCPSCRSLFPLDYQLCPKDGTHLVLCVALSPGMVLRNGKYRVIEEIARGGMGCVFKVKNLHLRYSDTLAAMKVPRSELAQNEKYVTAFLDEAAKASQLQHENIVSILDIDRMEGGIPFFVMEYVPGKTLREWMQDSPKPNWRRVADTGSEVAAALAAAHRSLVVHCDVKPENIISTTLISPVPLKVTDFGIARILQGLDSTPVDGTTGTPEYMSPEQTAIGKLTSKSDVYSLGIVLYEMASGSTPFSYIADRYAVMQAHRDLTPRPLDGPGIPPKLIDLVQQMLAKAPSNRPTANEVFDVLAQLKSDHSYTAAASVKPLGSPRTASNPQKPTVDQWSNGNNPGGTSAGKLGITKTRAFLRAHPSFLSAVFLVTVLALFVKLSGYHFRIPKRSSSSPPPVSPKPAQPSRLEPAAPLSSPSTPALQPPAAADNPVTNPSVAAPPDDGLQSQPRPAIGARPQKADHQASSMPPPRATVLVICNLPCNWKFDGVSQRGLDAGGSAIVPASIGDHIIEATTTDEADHLSREVVVSSPEQQIVRLELDSMRSQRLQQEADARKQQAAAEEAARESAQITQIQNQKYVLDPDNGTIWSIELITTRKTQEEADASCRNYSLGGYNDWRLPTAEEFVTMLRPKQSSPYPDRWFKFADGDYWTSTVAANPGKAVYFHIDKSFVRASPYDAHEIDSDFRWYSAFCVRSSH